MQAILENIGFTKGEIKVYFALLELGNTSSGPIITKSQVSRSKVYEILEKLKQKGLVTEVIKENIKYFQAASPRRIQDYIKNKEQQLKKEENDYKEILPQLLQKQRLQEQKQEVKVYVGFEGLKSFYNEILNQLTPKDEYLALTFGDKSINHNISLMYRKFHQKRAEKKAKAKILCNKDDKLAIKDMNFSDTPFYEFKITDQIIPTGVAIVRDIVATVNWGKIPRVFVIICKENADQYRKFFYNLWEKSKKKN
jgi:HTH-type transcriptional regulator, sugar sensing transcriptional regulator